MRKEYVLIGMLVVAVVGLTITVVMQRQSNGDEVAALNPDGPYVMASDPVAAGRYLMIIGGCNDCHTVDWDRTHGDVPESQWLLGSPVGFNGPWGTSYPGNVRAFMQGMSEDAWVAYAGRWHAVPPMPSMNLNRMSEQDLRAMHRYVRTLEPVGAPMPRNQPPGEPPIGPYFDFTVKNLPEGAG
jgi:mono/diheme cytochrome c family protein